MIHPGDLAARSSVLAAVALVLLNDRLLKPRYGNWLTGKLSDAAGIFVLPLLALSVIEVVRWGLRRSSWMVTPHETIAAVLVTAVGFAATKMIGPVGDAYAYAVGAIRWIIRVVAGTPTPYAPIEVIRDWTDVAVLPVLAATLRVARHRKESVLENVAR